MSEHDRIRWRCRRGMLELDLILGRFLDGHYPRLSASEQQDFEALLREQDDDLMEMISGNRAVEEGRFQQLIERLRLC